jgi:hypothetical protein
MEDMTPEERYRRIDNFMNLAAEFHAKHSELLARHDAGIERHDAAIRDLIVVSRTLVDSHQKAAAEMAEIRESLHILIDTVDRIIRKRES